MSTTTLPSRRPSSGLWLPDLGRSVDSLLLHKLRTLLTMLGMIFGVAAVLSMLSIGAGAQRQVMAFIQDLGVRNVIVEARETTEWQANQKVRQQSPGLSYQDVRAIRASVPGLELVTARKRFAPTRVVPKPDTETPVVYGVDPMYQQIAGLRVASGRFYTEAEAERAAAVCVLAKPHAGGSSATRIRSAASSRSTSSGSKLSGSPARRRWRRARWAACPLRIATT